MHLPSSPPHPSAWRLATMKITISNASDRFEMHQNSNDEVSFTIREDTQSQEVSISIKSSMGSSTFRGSNLNISVEPQASSKPGSASPFDIIVGTGTGRSIKARITSSMTVQELKVKLGDKEGIPVDQIRLMAGGQQMEDERLLSDYRLEHGSVIHMILRLSGS